MGKGDKKTKRGKIIMGSYGVRRSKKSKKGFVPDLTAKEPKAKVEKPVTEDAPKEKKKPAVAKKVVAEKTTPATKEVPKKKTTRKPADKETKKKDV